MSKGDLINWISSPQTVILILAGAFTLYLLDKFFSGATFKVPPQNLKNKYVIITGGNTGIGK